jgi:hypothetical protein
MTSECAATKCCTGDAPGTPASHDRQQIQLGQCVRLLQNHPHNLKVITSRLQVYNRHYVERPLAARIPFLRGITSMPRVHLPRSVARARFELHSKPMPVNSSSRGFVPDRSRTELRRKQACQSTKGREAPSAKSKGRRQNAGTKAQTAGPLTPENRCVSA